MADLSAHPYTKVGEVKPTQPVVVRVSIYWMQGSVGLISEYDDKTALATVSFLFRCTWIDPRLVGRPEDEPLPKAGELWRPIAGVWGANFGGTGRATVDDDGVIAFTKSGRETGEVTQVKNVNIEADCSTSADIHNFPLDSHFVSLVVTLGTSGTATTESVRYSLEEKHAELVLSYDAATGGTDPSAKVICRTQEEWVTAGVYWAVGQHVSVATGNAYSDFLIGIERKRTPTYMLHKAVYPTMLCAYFGLCTSLVPSSELEGRLSLLLSLFLTIYAIQWVTSDRIPRTSDLTKVDQLVSVVVVYLVSIATSSVALTIAERGVMLSESDFADTELYVSVCFAIVLLVLCAYTYLQIRRHETGGSTSSGRDVSPNWHAAPFGIASFRGRAFRRLTDKESYLQAPQSIPGQLDAPDDRADNPTFEATVDST
eukprot:COSAG02_NODE_49_length_45106_cov_298.436177_5_plen_428_part_00